MTRNIDRFKQDVLPRYVDWLNSFDGDIKVKLEDLTCTFEGSITKKTMRLVVFSVDSNDEGGPALVTACWKANYWVEKDPHWTLMWIIQEFDLSVDMVWNLHWSQQ